MRKNIRGFSLIEMMIAVTIAMIMSIGVLLIYAGQVRTFSQTARKAQTTQEAQSAFEVIAGLVRQAEMCLTCITQQTMGLTYPAGVANPNAAGTLQLAGDSVQIDFTVPSGYYIWPNITDPYTNNAIRIEWSAATNLVQVSAGASVADAAAMRTPIAIAGASGSMNTKIVNLDIWPMVVDAAGAVTAGALATTKPTAGYRIAMTARVGTADTTYTNPLDPNGALKNYRTVTYERIILPRNW
ncbi:MAG: prepilin-type N-terminal cleavage/methylation domain-containing protein [Gallionella sp.]|nr:prepilin-type N-terminal cleavage/methylation domain-containing protein [Gallionella sp.]